MKKYLLLFSALFVLAACNSGTNDSKDSTTKSTTTETGKNSSKKVHLLQKKLIQQTTAQLKIRRLVQIHKQVRQKPIHLTAIMPCQHGMS